MKVLTAGVPFSDSVEFLESNRYSYVYTEGAESDIQIQWVALYPTSVTITVSLDGLTDIYHATAYGNVVINILRTDTAFAPCLSGTGCLVRITLYGSGGASEYHVTVTTSESTTLLLWGTIVRGTVQAGGNTGYRALIKEPTTSISATAAAESDVKSALSLDLRAAVMSDTFRITVVQFSGQVITYISCSKGASSKMPNATDHMWTLSGGDRRYLDIPILVAADLGCFKSNPVSAGAASTGQLLVTVHGETASSFSVALSLLSNSSSLSSATLLTPGLPSVGSVANKEFRYYTVRPGTSREDIRCVSVLCHHF